ENSAPIPKRGRTASPSKNQFDSSGDASARHGDAGDFFVSGVAQIREFEVRTDPAVAAGGGQVPDRIRVMPEALDHSHPGTRTENIAELAEPGKRTVVAGIVENVLGHHAGQRLLRAVKPGVGQLYGLGSGQLEPYGGFDTGKSELLNVGRLPGRGGSVLHIVDVVMIPAVEDGQLGGDSAARIPLRAPFKIPSRLWFQERIPQVRGIAVVEVGIRGETKGTAGAGAKPQSLSQPNARGDGGSKLCIASAEDFLARAPGQKD